MDLEDIALRELGQAQKDKHLLILLIVECKKVRLLEIDYNGGYWGLGSGRTWSKDTNFSESAGRS
jgi:hypothetical protein